MLQYEISGEPNKLINRELIKKSVEAFNSTVKIRAKKNFSLAFVDSRTIRKFNRAYRGKDKVTDVLSFAQRDSDFISPGEERELGEILICLSRAKSQAKEYGWTLDHEVCRLLIHGLAHLIGYEHEGVSKKEEEKMVKFEGGVMEKLF
ncbi:MAG: rRNA maturation RNase YbeY [Candidatus Buchananbacteria bacterium]|jgi:probable rRNA maturation factor